MNKRTKYSRSLERIEIILTYACNRKCLNCEALVRQAPSNEAMTVEQIEKFLKQSIEKNVKWKSIRLLGGEPTLHPEIEKIVQILLEYKEKYSKECNITVVSNGSGEFVNSILDRLKNKYTIEIQNSNKISDIQVGFSPVNQAPIDMEEYKNMDFTKGCWIPTVCGIALDMNGFYPCSASAAFSRVSGNDIGRKEVPASDDSMEDIFRSACCLCGHYYNEINNEFSEEEANMDNLEELERIIDNYQKSKTVELHDEIISGSWKEILRKYKEKRPILKKY